MNRKSNFQKKVNLDKKIKQICKEKGWNPDSLSVGQMLFLMSNQEIKDSKNNSAS